MSDERWLAWSPRQVLDGFPVLTGEQVAFVLQLTVAKGARRGEPDARQVLQLVARGRLAPIDADLPVRLWRFSSTLVARYIDDPALIVIAPTGSVVAA